MEESTTDRILKNMTNMHELCRQLAFERGNPFYGLYSEDGGHYRKEVPNGDKYIVDVEVIMDENDKPVEIKDTIIRKLEA